MSCRFRMSELNTCMLNTLWLQYRSALYLKLQIQIYICIPVFIPSIYSTKACPAGLKCQNEIYSCRVISNYYTGPHFIYNCGYRYSGVHQKYLFNQGMIIPSCSNNYRIHVFGIVSGYTTWLYSMSNCRHRYVSLIWCSVQLFIQQRHEYSRRYNTLLVLNV